MNLRPPFWIFCKNSWPSSPATLDLVPMICPRREDWAPFFYRKFRNCSFKHYEIWKKGQFKALESCCDISELEDNSKNCSERKKLLEIREVAKKLPSNLWKALGVVTSLTLSLFIVSLFCSSKTLFRAFALLAALHISRRSLWKATPQRLYWENRCSSFSFNFTCLHAPTFY